MLKKLWLLLNMIGGFSKKRKERLYKLTLKIIGPKRLN